MGPAHPVHEANSRCVILTARQSRRSHGIWGMRKFRWLMDNRLLSEGITAYDHGFRLYRIVSITGAPGYYSPNAAPQLWRGCRPVHHINT